MNYQEEYRSKKVSVAEALSHIPADACITTSLCAQAPSLLLSQLHHAADDGRSFTVYSNMNMRAYPYATDESYADRIRVDSLFMMGGDRPGYKKGLLNYVPGHLHNGPWRWEDNHPTTVFIGAVSPMDSHGFCRFSLCNILEQEFAAKADLVICEVNPNFPKVGGQTEIHIRDIDYLVESSEPIPVLPESSEPSGADLAIGQNIASLVRDGDTIQLGIGKIPDAVAKCLLDKHDLGVHTEMLTNSIVDLTEAGVITNRKKTLMKGKTVATFALGSQRLYDMMHDNPSVWIMPGNYLNNPALIAQNDNMVSINTAIEVDLTGQVFSESVGTMMYSGSGGQSDTAQGAVHSRGGRSIIALHSTAKKGTVSTINAIATPGAIVTLSRNNVDYIVTEYGIAPMRGRTAGERAANLIAAAHPDFREQLRKDVEKYYIR